MPCSAASISGNVRFRPGGTPPAGVAVFARAAGGPQLYQSALTDSAGRYELRNLPRARMAVTAARPHYLPRAAAGGAASLLFDLSADETLDGADFLMVPGGVVTGRITDSLGEPAESVRIVLTPLDRSGERRRSAASTASTDDRGVYRIFGLAPGRYVLRAGPLPGLSEMKASALYYPGTRDPARAAVVEVRAGGEASSIDIALGVEPGYRLSGRIAGFEAGVYPLYRISATTLGAEGGMTYFSWAGAQGAFAFGGLTPGPYLLSASGMARGAPKTIARQLVDLQADLTGVQLRVAAPGRLTGRVVFSATLDARRRPPAVQLRLRAAALGELLETTAEAPGYRFEFPSVWPGPYRLDAAGETYVLEVKEAGRKPLRELVIAEGTLTEVEALVALDLVTLQGRVKQPAAPNPPLAHALVALAPLPGPWSEVRTAPTDQNGRFVFSELRPGDYRICAWAGAEPDDLASPEIWSQAGAAVKRMSIDPGARIDLDLTAAAPPP